MRDDPRYVNNCGVNPGHRHSMNPVLYAHGYAHAWMHMVDSAQSGSPRGLRSQVRTVHVGRPDPGRMVAMPPLAPPRRRPVQICMDICHMGGASTYISLEHMVIVKVHGPSGHVRAFSATATTMPALGLKPLRDLFYFWCAPFEASRRLPRPLIKPLPRLDSFGQKYSAVTSQT